MNWVYVFIGGGLGSMLRYFFALMAQKFAWSNNSLPTFAANVLGCFIIGAIAAYVSQQMAASPQVKWFWMVGFCGGFTTFSSFALEALNGFKQGIALEMLGYMLLTNICCLAAVWAGSCFVKS